MYNLDSDSEEEYDEILDQIFFKKYHCIKKLGEGAFGTIYESIYQDEKYALKFEDRKKDHNLLQNEAAIMNYLKGPNIPFVKSYGFTSNYNIVIMQLLGKSLDNLLSEKKKFSLKTVCMLGHQMINILDFIHERHILHRDIKPDNFLMGLDELSDNVYLIDFGLAKKYRSMTTLVQYPLVQKNKLTGTARYASINALKGYEQSRRDDLESLGYTLIYFLKGRLPWQRVKADTKEEKYKIILDMKMKISSKELCDGLPKEFEEYLEYVKKLNYEEKPNYEKLRKLFDNIMKREKYTYDYIYDWTTVKEKESRKNIKNKTEPTNGETLTYHENVKKSNNIDLTVNNEIYYIQRNNKSFEKLLSSQEPAVCCTTSCIIF